MGSNKKEGQMIERIKKERRKIKYRRNLKRNGRGGRKMK
jgi:hypothetical protein